MLHVVMTVKLADPSKDVSFPTNKNDSAPPENSVLIPKEIFKGGSYIAIYFTV